MTDLIRMAAPAHHYLYVYDQHTGQSLYLARTKRLATAAQRIEETGWTTRTNSRARTEWLPPPDLDTGQARTNNFHDPQRFLLPDHESDGEDP